MNEHAFYGEIGKRVRVARDRMGATQESIAAKAGVIRTTLTNVETGKQRLPLHKLAAVADAIGVPLSSLIPGGTPEASDPRPSILDDLLPSSLSTADVVWLREVVRRLVAGLEREKGLS